MEAQIVETDEEVSIPSIQVCISNYKDLKEVSVFVEYGESQSLLFRSVFPTLPEFLSRRGAMLGLNPFYSGLYFQLNTGKIKNKITKMSQSLLFRSVFPTSSMGNDYIIRIYLSLNPFYSGLYFQLKKKSFIRNFIYLCLNPFYSGLYFQHLFYYIVKSYKYQLSQSLLFRSVFPT